MSGHWPPEWEDPEGEFPEEANAEAMARLSEVAAFLASVPAPSLPDAVEARISAGLAAEAATRAERPAPADGARNLGPAPARARVRRHRGGDRPRRRFRVRPQVVGGSLVTCLLLAVLGFALSHASFSSSSGSSAAAAGSNNMAASSATSAGSSAVGSNAEAGPAAAPSPAASSAAAASSAPAAGPESPGTGSSFAVTASGTRYEQVTLAGQVRSRLTANGVHDTSGTTVPAASASVTSVAAGPSPALRGCVLHLTGGVIPRLVDRATFQGEPAYVIASSSHVWVVGLGCTAAKPELVASVPLAG